MSASTSSSSAASIAAAIYNSKDDGREQVSDVVYDTINNVDDDMSNDDTSDEEDKETDEDVFFGGARKIMNQSNNKIGMATMEECRFRSFFGARNEILLKVWSMLGGGGLGPENSKPKHMLWALYFLKVYPREGPGCYLSVGLRVPSTLRPCRNGSGSF
jgi:hypothetical protein